jgi:hypothetical protein
MGVSVIINMESSGEQATYVRKEKFHQEQFTSKKDRPHFEGQNFAFAYQQALSCKLS